MNFGSIHQQDLCFIDSWISGVSGAFENAVKSLILPAIVLGTVPLAIITRMTRSAMLEVLGEDYIPAQQSKRFKLYSNCYCSRIA